MRHVVMYSGGITSWAVARRLVDLGLEPVLLFADVLVEDEDLYRFNRDVERDLGIPVTRVCDGRTPEEVDVDRRWLSNSKVAQCSLELKIKPCRQWLEAHCDPADTTIYVGIDWSETHRLPAISAMWAPWTADAPLTRPPYVHKRQQMLDARARGLEPPRLYAMGFEHNNCGGACIRGGQAQWAHLLRTFPERFAAKEGHEKRMRAELGADVAILRDRRGGVTKPLPLTVLRERVAASEVDALDWGGCGCFTEATA